MRSELQAYQNVVGRWKEELNGEVGSVLLFSSFITPSTIYTVLEDAVVKNCEVYTVFKAENYANGSSSLGAIKKLLQRGVALYYLDGLHAKTVIKLGKFASVGSQNITSQGTRSLEISVALNKPVHVGQVEKKVAKWLEKRVPITMPMVVELENNLKSLKKSYKMFFRGLCKA